MIQLAYLFVFIVLCVPSLLPGQNHLENLIQEQIDEMTVQEKIAQIHRNTFWTTANNNKLNIPGFVMSDGPHGVRFVASASFPTGIAIAASWNKDLAYQVGQAMGRLIQQKHSNGNDILNLSTKGMVRGSYIVQIKAKGLTQSILLEVQ